MRRCITAALLTAFALLLTGCLTKPGKGRKANACYRAAAPVIAALEKYHADHGRYPLNLASLVPTYLPNTDALRARPKISPASHLRADFYPHRPDNSSFDWFWYQSKENAYSLMFQYTGPGLNSCSYDSTTKQWTASGHY